jgi:hypothetical protein
MARGTWPAGGLSGIQGPGPNELAGQYLAADITAHHKAGSSGVIRLRRAVG